jgi:hypothetical protein
MSRIHLFEFTDLPWYPPTFRRMQTDYLQFAAARGSAQRFLAPLLQKAMQSAGTSAVVDLCSGGSGPWVRLQEQFERDGWPVQITLTDKFPNPDALERWDRRRYPSIRYLAQPVDALNVPASLPGMRTLFEGFHHFRPQEARSILQHAYDQHAAIGIFEITLKPPFGWILLLLSPLMTLVSYLLLTPFITPRSWSRFFWTYLLPVVPLATCWDGLISLLRVYDPQDLKDLTRKFDSSDYAWEIGLAPTGTPIFEYTYLLGYPVAMHP